MGQSDRNVDGFSGRMASEVAPHLPRALQLSPSDLVLREGQRLAKLGIWEWAPETGEVLWSEELYRILGCEVGSPMSNVSARNFFEANSWSLLMSAVRDALTSRKPYALELQIRPRDGQSSWIFCRGEVIGDMQGAPRLRGTVQDITEQKRINEALIESEAKFRGLAEQSLVGISIHDVGGFVYINPKFAQMLGYSQAELLEMMPLDVVAESDWARAQDLIDSRLRGEVAHVQFIVKCVRKDKKVIDLECHGSVMNLNGRRASISIVLDITERVNADSVLERSMQQIRALSQRIMHVQQLERDRIARELHDELGQTLTAVKMNLQMLEPVCIDGDAEYHLTEALVIVGRALHQVRDMMLDLRPAGIDDFGLVVALRNLFEKQATSCGWISHFESSTVVVRLPRPLEIACFRVAQEALTNVMRHASATEVWISIERRDAEVIISIRDNGRGFDADSQRGGPNGFGLLGMEERIREICGTMSIESSVGQGTNLRACFYISDGA